MSPADGAELVQSGNEELGETQKSCCGWGGPKAPAGPGAGRSRPARPAAGRPGGLLRQPDPPAAHAPPVSRAQGGKGWRGAADRQQPRAAKSPWPCCPHTTLGAAGGKREWWAGRGRPARHPASVGCATGRPARQLRPRRAASVGVGSLLGGTLGGQGGPLWGWGGVGKVDAEGL